MYNLPEDCGLNSSYDLPWDSSKEVYCPECGSNMFISSFCNNMLECENNSCGEKIILELDEEY